MRKIILVAAFQILIAGWVYAGWPINRTPRIEGVITDATTGEPLENVVVSARWVKRVPAPGDSISKGFASYIALTDKEGRYKIPAKISIHPLSGFDYLSIGFLHPLYGSRGAEYWNGSRGSLVRGKAGIYEERRGKNSINVARKENGIIHYDVKLMRSFNFDPEYFIAARKAKTNVNDLEKLFKENEKNIGQKQKEIILKVISMNERDVKRNCVFYHGHWELWEDK